MNRLAKPIHRDFLLPLLAIWLGASLYGQAASDPKPGPISTNQLASFELPDQFEQPHKIEFPRSRVTLLTVADRAGSEQISAWVQALKKRYGKTLPIEGVADVASVPALLRSTVRKKFREKFPLPIMMDWHGSVTAQLHPIKDEANILLLATNGRILLHLHGQPDEAKLTELCNLIGKNSSASATSAISGR